MTDTPVQRTSDTEDRWFIKSIEVRGRWVWEIPYPISRFSLVGVKTFATKASACRDARRVIKLLGAKANVK